MERILNDDEKIRKAEEIYYRRNNQNFNVGNKPTVKKDKVLKDKILLQLLVMINIAILIFCIQNRDFIFTTEFLNVLNDYNNRVSSKVVEFFSGILNGRSDDNENIVENEFVKDEINKENVQNQGQNNSEENGGTQSENNEETIMQESSSSISEMELDIQNLKSAYSFVKPINGIVSSGFGARESEYQNVTGYHTGIDLAADKGTIIKASMQGIVEQVSSQGDYGKHVKIRCNNVTTLYAHCSKIYVKEGQIVAQNQEIATVGSTGNSTGPHLHFEIRVEDRFVDPAKIIEF